MFYGLKFKTFSFNKHGLYSSNWQLLVSEVFLNLRCGDKLQLQEVQSAAPHTLHTEDLRFKGAGNYGKIP